MSIRSRKIVLLSGFLLIVLCGCDPVNRHKVLSTIFDGVPNPPPPEQVCAEYADKKIAQMREEAAGKKLETTKKSVGSEHNPYAEKRCDDCHNKTTESGFVTSKDDLCYVCHTDFIKGTYVHGPVAVKNCLFCHEPHNAQHPSLLKKEPSEICAMCHVEKRKAYAMHEKVALQKIGCVDCHDPHYGNIPFFLK